MPDETWGLLHACERLRSELSRLAFITGNSANVHPDWDIQLGIKQADQAIGAFRSREIDRAKMIDDGWLDLVSKRGNKIDREQLWSFGLNVRHLEIQVCRTENSRGDWYIVFIGNYSAVRVETRGELRDLLSDLRVTPEERTSDANAG